jgi:1,6-anhydro-N-acetylmuramate kinase
LSVLIKKYPQSAKKLVLCGGMANCPGIKERVQLEMSDFQVELDEHFIWKSSKKNNV